MEKKWYQSSTIWINLLGIVVIVLEMTVATNLIPDPEIVALIVAVLNILRRFQAPKRVATIEKSVI
jgi:H+/Cl- antiporter ClcA